MKAGLLSVVECMLAILSRQFQIKMDWDGLGSWAKGRLTPAEAQIVDNLAVFGPFLPEYGYFIDNPIDAAKLKPRKRLTLRVPRERQHTKRQVIERPAP